MMTKVRGDVRQRGTEVTWLVNALSDDLMNMMVIVIMMAIKMIRRSDDDGERC